MKGFFPSLLMMFGVLVAFSIAAVAEAAPISYGDIKAFNTQVDGDTSSSYDVSIFKNIPADDGRVWTDKTVSAGTGADADEFSVTLSTMAQSVQHQYEDVPSDTVFILDVSASMTNPTEQNAPSRIAVMVDALNKAIDLLMADNKDNRIAVVAFGGDTEQKQTPRVVLVLGLGRYEEVTDGIYFSMFSPGYVQIDDDIIQAGKSALPNTDERTAAGQIRVYGGTSTQWGIYEGAKILTNQTPPAIYGEADNETPKPNIVLLTDGEPTFGWTDFTFSNSTSPTAAGFSNGNGNDVQMGQEILTVLTASYFKQQVSKHYYGLGSPKEAGFYTIGLGVEDSDDARATLNPAGIVNGEDQINAAKISNAFGGTTYNMREVLDNIIRSGAASFPALVKRAGAREVVNATYPDANILPLRDRIVSYNYADYYGEAATIDELNQFFDEITTHIISQSEYATSVINDPAGMYESESASYADYSGAVVFSDVIGEFMEFKQFDHLLYHDEQYNGAAFAAQMVKENPNAALANTHGATTAKTLNTMFASQLFFRNIMGTHPTEASVQSVVESLLSSSLAAGDGVNSSDESGIYYNSATDFGNRVRFYADSSGTWTANYFNADGTVNTTALNGATSIVDQYYVSGATTNFVSGNPSDLTYSIFEVITALESNSGSISVAETNFTVDGNTNTIQPHTVATRNLQPGQQLVRWIVPASLLPLRSVKTAQDGSLALMRTTPIRFIYSVGLRSDFSLANPNVQAYTSANGYDFYTNDWDDSGSVNDAMAHFIPSPDNPYYYASDATPAPVDDDTDLQKSISRTSTDTYSTGKPQANSSIWYYPLGNNGRLEVPRTKLTVTKNWDDELDNAFVHSEYIQLYRDGTPVGDPQQVIPSNKTATTEWTDLQLYEPEANESGHARLVPYTIKEGTGSTRATFVPYDTTSTSGLLRIDYAQPTLNASTNTLEAIVANRPKGDRNWIVDITKKFDANGTTLNTADIDAVLEDQDKSIEFYLFTKVNLPSYGEFYVQTPLQDPDELIPENRPIHYPADFAGGQRSIWFTGELVDPSEMTYLLVEVVDDDNPINGYRYDASRSLVSFGSQGSGINLANTPQGFAAVDGNTNIPLIYAQLDSNGHPTSTVFPFASGDFEINEAHAHKIIVNDGETAKFEVTNYLQPIVPPSVSLTLGKSLIGVEDDNFAATFVIEGWTSADAVKTRDLSQRIYYQTVDYGSAEMPSGKVSLSGLPPGHYTVAEYAANSFRLADNSTEDEGDFITLKKTLKVTGAGTSLVNNNAVAFSLDKGDTAVTIDLTNAYAPVTKTPPSSNTPPSGGGDSPPPSAPVCTAQKPGEPAPYIFKATRNSDRSITLAFHVGAEPFTKYLLRYGLAGGDYTFGATLDNPKDGKITINDLQPGQTYQFQLIPMNDCQSGSYSNVFPVSLGQLPKVPGVPNTGLKYVEII